MDCKEIQIKMRQVVMNACSGDRFRLKFHMSTETLSKLTENYHQEMYEQTESARQEQHEFVTEIINAEYSKPSNVIGLILDNLVGIPSRLERNLSVLRANSIKPYIPISFDLLGMFMGRPIEIDETIPYGEFKTNL